MSQYRKQREDSQEPDTGENINYTWPIVTQTQKRTMPQNQLNNHLVSAFAGNIQCEFAVVVYNEILFYISYSLCLAFRLYCSMIVFYTSIEFIKLSFLENKIRSVCCIFANFIFIFETKVNMCILQTQSVTLIFLYFYYPHELERGNTYNKEQLYIMTCIHREK